MRIYNRKSPQSGFGILALTLVAAVIIGGMIFVANESFKGSAASRSRVKEQVAALDVMKDLAILLRRSYDVARAHNEVCPPALFITHSPVLVGSDGQPVPLCFPRGIESCVSHPMDPNPAAKDQWNLSTPNPVLCFHGSPSNFQRINISFRVNPATTTTVWNEFRQKWMEKLGDGAEKFVQQLDPLPRAEAQAELGDLKVWYPKMAVLNAAGLAMQSNAASPHNVRSCASPSTLCISYSVCLRMEGCRGTSNAAARPLEEFLQTVALDR